MWYIAAAGGFAGLAFATWLTRMTEVAWPLPTGNMPIVAWWPNLIVIFELTMLGGILAAVATLLVTAKLPGKRPAIYDAAVMDGKILVGVDSPRDAAAVERALRVGTCGACNTPTSTGLHAGTLPGPRTHEEHEDARRFSCTRILLRASS